MAAPKIAARAASSGFGSGRNLCIPENTYNHIRDQGRRGFLNEARGCPAGRQWFRGPPDGVALCVRSDFARRLDGYWAPFKYGRRAGTVGGFVVISDLGLEEFVEIVKVLIQLASHLAHLRREDRQI